MKRFTEYHNGVAVIKDKALMKDAMRKLAGYEDAQEGSREYGIEKITTEMAEYICDMCCGNLDDVSCQEDADEICAECKLGKFICEICNEYNSINTFVGSQIERLMMKNAELEKELQRYKDLEEQGLLLRLDKDSEKTE